MSSDGFFKQISESKRGDRQEQETVLDRMKALLKSDPRPVGYYDKIDKETFGIYKLLSGTPDDAEAERYADILISVGDSYADLIRYSSEHDVTLGADDAAAAYRVASYFASGEKEDLAVAGFIKSVAVFRHPYQRIFDLSIAVSDYDGKKLLGSHPGSKLRQRALESLSKNAKEAKKAHDYSAWFNAHLSILKASSPDGPFVQSTVDELLRTPKQTGYNDSTYFSGITTASIHVTPDSEREEAAIDIFDGYIFRSFRADPDVCLKKYMEALEQIHRFYNEENSSLGGKMPGPGERGHALMIRAASGILKNAACLPEDDYICGIKRLAEKILDKEPEASSAERPMPVGVRRDAHPRVAG